MEKNKKCANCNHEDLYTDIEERTAEMFEFAPEEFGPLEFFKLCRYHLEM